MDSIYLRAFDLDRDPFKIAPDPSFLYLSQSHQEALAELEYGIKARKGFACLTGEVGTGKTTLIHALLERLDASTHTALVFNTIVSPKDLLRYVCEDLAILPYETNHRAIHDYLTLLNRFLLESYRKDENVALIIDEAQNLSAQVLESVRLLSNFETSRDKLLQILLVGQPELKAKLERPELRQLKQRIGLRCTIRPLQPEEIGDYIRLRLRLAGAPDLGLFTNRAIQRIGEHTQGIPRLVNMVCDHCLVIAYADQKRKIGAEIVDEAIAYLEGKDEEQGAVSWSVSRGAWAAPLRWMFGAIAAALLAAMMVMALHGEAWGNLSALLEPYLFNVSGLVRDIRDFLVG